MRYLIAVEVIKNNNNHQILYVSYSFETLGSYEPSKEEVEQFAKEYLKDIEGEKNVKFVYCLNDDMYDNIFETQLKDYII